MQFIDNAANFVWFLKSLEELKLFRFSWKCSPDSTGMLTQLKKLASQPCTILNCWNLKKCKDVGGEFETTTNSRGQGALIKVDASEVSHSKVVVQRTKGNE